MPELADILTPLEKKRLINLRQRLKARGIWEEETQSPGKHLISDLLEDIEDAPVDEHGVPLRKICRLCASPSRDDECGKCYRALRATEAGCVCPPRHRSKGTHVGSCPLR